MVRQTHEGVLKMFVGAAGMTVPPPSGAFFDFYSQYALALKLTCRTISSKRFAF